MKFLKDIVDNTPLPIAVYEGEQLTIKLANPAMIKTWGKGDQVIGKNYLDVLPEIKNDTFFEQAYSVLKTGIPFHATDKKVELIINGINKVHYFNYSFIPLFDENKKVYGVMNTGVDVSELNFAKLHFEEELQSQIAYNTHELRRSNDDLTNFANIVSHDLREPVRKIKIFQNQLHNDKETAFTENGKRYLLKISQSANRMENIIEGVLAYSTIDKSVQPIEIIDLNEVIESIKNDLELIIHEKGAILVTGKLPPIEGALILITQLFYNLIQNALKFSKKDLPPRIIINSSLINLDGVDCVQVIVKDNGIGVDQTFSEKIFNAFERLHSKDKYEGNGLGLSLCRKIAKRHKGTITAKGEIDNGTEFIVTLPLKQALETI